MGYEGCSKPDAHENGHKGRHNPAGRGNRKKISVSHGGGGYNAPPQGLIKAGQGCSHGFNQCNQNTGDQEQHHIDCHKGDTLALDPCPENGL